MNKKNIGAALSVIAAVTAGATAYASTMNNLTTDRNTKVLIAPNYTESMTLEYNMVKSDFTKDLKNTKIANEKRKTVSTNDTKEEVAKIEEAAKEFVAKNIDTESLDKENEDIVTYESSDSDDTDLNEEAYNEEVVAYDDSNLEEKEEAEVVNEKAEDSYDNVVDYDNKNLDSDFNNEDESATLKQEVAQSEVVNYLDNNIEVVDENEDNSSLGEVKRFVNVKALNIRSDKSMSDDSNIVRTVLAGDELTGTIEGAWLKSEEGYIKLEFLSEDYPKALVDKLNEEAEALNAQKEAEERKAEEAKAAEEERKAEEAKAAEEEKIAAEKAEEEAKIAQEANQTGEAFTGWVYNTDLLIVRDKAVTGNVIGYIAKGDKITGEILDDWVKFDYNGSPAYTSAYYLSTTEVEPDVSAPVQNEEVVMEEEDVYDEPIVAEATSVGGSGVDASNIAAGFIGSPYVWGASSPSVGFDCSGLTSYAYGQLGISIPHSSQAQFNSGYAVDSSSLIPGDLIFFSFGGGAIDHVGIITSSDGTFVHASTPDTGVKYDNVYNSHYQSVFRGARRIF